MASVTVSRILHAGYVFEAQGCRIAFDTLFENPFSFNCHAFPDLRFDTVAIRQLRFSAVFISHFHDDHCSLDSLDLLDRATPLFVHCVHEELFAMLRALGFTRVAQLAFDVPVQVGPFTVTPRAGMEPEVDAMFQLQCGEVNILNVVDTWIDDEALARLVALGPWDMVLWPFQAMRELEVLMPTRAEPASGEIDASVTAQLQRLAPRIVVPSSCQFRFEPWSWVNHAFFPISYAGFAAQVAAALPTTRVLRLDPGVSVRLNKQGARPAPRLPWIVPAGPQGADYDYQPRMAPPATAAIAARLAPLAACDWAHLRAWCQVELPRRYAHSDTLGTYFDVARNWRLTLVGHDGCAEHFCFRLEPGGQVAALAPDAAIQWSTELPAAKLLSALDGRESLTSLYLRINAQGFDAQTESDLIDAEAVDDPLVRCLFDGAFGSYQAAQLRRLLARATTPDSVSSQ